MIQLESNSTTVALKFAHSGDLGDIVSSLPAVRQLGGGSYSLCTYPHRSGGPREPMSLKRAMFLLPLLRAQSYITEANFEQVPREVTHDFTTLRLKTHKDDGRDTLSDWHANHLGITEPLDTSPWLKAEPDPNYVGKVVVARSLRYNNPEFPWTRIFDKHKGNIAFIGHASECHKLLTRARGRLPIARCEDALHMARIIAASSECYMNQSFPLWVALGLGKKVSVECWRPSPDVRIPRDNARYIFSRRENPEFFKNL